MHTNNIALGQVFCICSVYVVYMYTYIIWCFNIIINFDVSLNWNKDCITK